MIIRHLTSADYRQMPWANGKGSTTELIRVNRPDGNMLWRLSMAAVIEDGAFSNFPGVDRSLTVISGAGFDLATAAGKKLRADFLKPVSFPGDEAISAVNVIHPCTDFNVMVARGEVAMKVQVQVAKQEISLAGQTNCVFALQSGEVVIDGQVFAVDRHELLMTETPAEVWITCSEVICVELTGL